MLWKKFLIANPERLQVKKFDGTQTQWFTPTDRREVSEVIIVPHHLLWTITFGRSRLDRDFSHYDDLRNLPAVDGSTRLSPYIRFGIFSIREIYTKIQDNPTLLSEIIWREFWYQIAYYFPFTYSLEFQERRRHIDWLRDIKSYEYEKFEK
jgi:deoxyribodipyrimidine photo-lyase